MPSYALTLILFASLIASTIAIYIAMIRRKDIALILAIAATVVLVANVLYLLYLLAFWLNWDFPFSESARFYMFPESVRFYMEASFTEAFKVTPVLTLFSAPLLFLKRLRRFVPVLIPLVAANILLGAYDFFLAAASF